MHATHNIIYSQDNITLMYITFVFVSYLDIKPPGIWLSPSQSPLRIQWEVFFWLPSPSTCFWLAFKTYDTDYTDDLGEKVGLLSCWFLRFQPKHFQRQQIRLQKLRFVFRRAYRHRGRSKPPNTTYMKIESHLLNKNQRIRFWWKLRSQFNLKAFNGS